MPIGVFFAFAAYAVYASADAIIKGFGQSLSVFEIGFFMTAFSVIPVILTKPRHESLREVFKANRPWLLHLRAATGVSGAMLVIYAFTTIPLAEAYALVFLTPIFTTILSLIFLHETMTARRWAMLFFGFVGVMVVVRPGFRELAPGHFAAIGCATFACLSAIVLRAVSQSEKRISIVGYAVVWALVVNGLLMIPSFVVPEWHQLALLAAIGLLGGTGHVLMITATRTATANLVAPTQYSQIIWATIFGGVFYAEYPDTIAAVGLAVIVLSGVLGATPVRARSWFGTYTFARRRPAGSPPEPGVPVEEELR